MNRQLKQDVKIFCLPYAGGSVAIYNKWFSYINKSICLVPIELAGRGRRFKEPLHNSFEDAVNDIVNTILSNLNGEAIAIYGHSLGSLFAFEVAHRLQELGDINLIHVFFSGSCPPHIKNNQELIHNLPDEEFIKRIHELGGTPIEILENKSLLDLLIPIIKSDYKIFELYACNRKNKKLMCDISILNGNNDQTVSSEDISAWNEYTSGACKKYIFFGNHFFINDNTKEIVDLVNKTLKMK